MNFSLTPQLEEMIRQRVESGKYNNASEVVRDALRHLESSERLDHLRALIQVGLDEANRGELIDFTPEWEADMDRRVREGLLRGDTPDPDVCP